VSGFARGDRREGAKRRGQGQAHGDGFNGCS
jgi:hypothetical protein